MNEIGDDCPLKPKPSKGPLLDRLAHWLYRKTRTDYETDKPLIESEGPVLVERLVPGRTSYTALINAETYWGDVTVIVTRARLRIYSGEFHTVADISLADPNELSSINASLNK